jgi:hypothetical protein
MVSVELAVELVLTDIPTGSQFVSEKFCIVIDANLNLLVHHNGCHELA